MYSTTIIDVTFLLTVTVIWFMIGYQALLFFKGNAYYHRTRRSKFLPAMPDSVLPGVSVLVPCHNEELVIEDTVRALLALDYPAHLLQILIIDDGSTDQTAEIVERFTSIDRVRLLQVPAAYTARGKSGALNYGLAHTTHPVLAIYDVSSFILHPQPPCTRHSADARCDCRVSGVRIPRALGRKRRAIRGSLWTSLTNRNTSPSGPRHVRRTR